MTRDQLEAAREWIRDCMWADMDASDFDRLTAAQIERGIARHYDGGVEAFVLDVAGV